MYHDWKRLSSIWSAFGYTRQDLVYFGRALARRKGAAVGAGHNIRRVREQRGYDQAELARLVGISPSALWKVENEDRTPRGPTLRKLAEVLSVDPAELRSASGQ
jgi:DNA-binding XRE family transcriptional regulator